MVADVGPLSRGAASHRDAAIALPDVPESACAHPTLCVASDRNALALPRDHYCVRLAPGQAPQLLSSSRARTTTDARIAIGFHGSCSLSRPDRTRRPPYPTLASSIAHRLAARLH